MKTLRWYVVNLLVALDQLITAVFAGWCDETLSSYFHRLDQANKPAGKVMRPLVDWMFRKAFGQNDHCRKAYEEERARAQMPPELR